MRDAGQAGDVPRFLELDIQFHSLLLSGSGNEMFANLVGQVAETLTGRTVHGLMPDHPRDVVLQWHVDVAEAIVAGDAAEARDASSQIMRQTISEMEPVWVDQPRVFVPVPPPLAIRRESSAALFRIRRSSGRRRRLRGPWPRGYSWVMTGPMCRVPSARAVMTSSISSLKRKEPVQVQFPGDGQGDQDRLGPGGQQPDHHHGPAAGRALDGRGQAVVAARRTR